MTLRNVDGARPAIDALNAAIRDNPLAAGLIGAGVAWMLLGGSKGLGTIAGLGVQGVRAGGSGAASAARGVASAASRVAGGLQQVAEDVSGAVTSIVPDSSMQETATDAAAGVVKAAENQWSTLASAGRDYGTAMQARLSDSLQRQPLMLGVIGLTIGAGIAAAFATTATEGALMGERGTDVRNRLQGFATEAKDIAGEVVSEIKKEAQMQGLTPGGAREAAAAIGEKARSVADAARDSLKEGVTRR